MLPKQLKKLLAPILKLVKIPLDFLKNKKVSLVIKALLIIYAVIIVPRLPKVVIKLFNNPLVKLVILAMIIYTGVKDPIMSLLIAVAFVITMMTLNKLETINNLDDIIKGAVDIPQSLLNQTIDGAQDLVKEGTELIIDPVKEVAGVANKLVDVAQDLTNKAIDGVQDMIPKISEEKKENFSMEDRNLDVEVAEMGNLDGLSGYSGEEIGASINMEEPEALKQ